MNQIIDHSKPCLYIPLAMKQEKYDGCYEWITGELRAIEVPGIDMVRSAEELSTKNLNDYSFLFIGGGNTFKLLHDLKTSSSFEKISEYINNDGIVFGGSAGAIIFGKDLEACKLADVNEVNLQDIIGFDILNGVSILCHYTNCTPEKDEESKQYLLELSQHRKIVHQKKLPCVGSFLLRDRAAYRWPADPRWRSAGRQSPWTGRLPPCTGSGSG